MKPYPYQIANAKLLAALGAGADLSEVGTGKTITAIETMKLCTNALGGIRVLIVAPKSVVHQWQDKLQIWWPEMDVFRPNGATRTDRVGAYDKFRAHFSTFPAPKALIVTYEQVRADIDILSVFEFDVIYADEIHRIGNPLTQISKAMAVLNSERRYGATATPLRSSPLQAFGIFHWLNPGVLGKNYYHFKFHHTITDSRGWVLGYMNLDDLGRKIKPYFVKTSMEEAGHFLPPLVEEDIVFSLSRQEQGLYDKMKKEMLLEIEAAEISKIKNPTSLYNSVVKLGKMQELTDSLELLGEKKESSKISVLREHLSDTLVSDNKAVIFTRFSRMADILFRELPEFAPALITGVVQDREQQIDRFNNEDKCRIIIITTAGNEGINLQRANRLYMVDVPLGSYGSLVQTIGRINRIGQIKPMVVYYLLAEKTVDVSLKKLLLNKKNMSEKIFGSFADIREVLE